SPSMAVWRPTATALRLLLERQGSFQSVRTFVLSTPADTDRPSAPRLHGPGGGSRSPAELLDPTGRQVFLILTDGFGPLWRDPRTDRLLRLWGRSGPLAIVNPFPQVYWHRTNLVPRTARLHPPGAVAPNDTLRVQYADNRSGPFDEPVAPGSLPVPILELN